MNGSVPIPPLAAGKAKQSKDIKKNKKSRLAFLNGVKKHETSKRRSATANFSRGQTHPGCEKSSIRQVAGETANRGGEKIVGNVMPGVAGKLVEVTHAHTSACNLIR